jgi:hypothetical protein
LQFQPLLFAQYTALHCSGLLWLQLEKRGAEVDEKLGRFTSIPTSEAAADSKTDELLREVEKRFRDACKNAAFKVEGENATTGMIAAIDAAATSYVAKQVRSAVYTSVCDSMTFR